MPACLKCGAALQPQSSDFCAVCGAPLLSPPHEEAKRASPAFSVSAIPWESVEDLGIARAALRTLGECLFSPFAFFTKVASSSASPHNAAMSFVYALVLGSAGSIAGFLWTWLFPSGIHQFLARLDGFQAGLSASAVVLIIAPLLISAKVIFFSVYIQTLLLLTGTKRQGVTSTFSIACYAEGASVLNLIPLAGSAASLVWFLFLLTVGLRRVHRVGMAKALAIVFLPLLFMGIICILALAVLAGASAFLNGLQ